MDIVGGHERVHRHVRPRQTREIKQDRLGVLNLREVNRDLLLIHIKRW